MHVLDAQGRLKVTPGFPVGAITPFYGTVLPQDWALCDGTLGTPDMRDRFIIGDSIAGTGTASGTVSPVIGATHTNAAVANHADHAVTQPSAHSNHVVGQPTTHTAHGVTQNAAHGTHGGDGDHNHDAHTTTARTIVGVASEVATPTDHSFPGTHTHDAHSAHTGAAVDAHGAHAAAAVDAHSAHSATAVDAHSVHAITQNTAHALLKAYTLAFVMRVGS